MSAKIYKISSHWDGRMSSLDGEDYETFDAALADCRKIGSNELVAESVDYGNEQAWLIYSDEEAAEQDADGRSNNAIARIETVTSDEDKS